MYAFMRVSVVFSGYLSKYHNGGFGLCARKDNATGHMRALTSWRDMLSCRLRRMNRSTALTRCTIFRFEPQRSVGNICQGHKGSSNQSVIDFFLTPGEFQSFFQHIHILTRWITWHKKSVTPRCPVAISVNDFPGPSKTKPGPFAIGFACADGETVFNAT